MSPLAGDGRKLVDRRLHVFLSLGSASLLLRRVDRGGFGVFSTPILHLLQIHRENTVDKEMINCIKAICFEWEV